MLVVEVDCIVKAKYHGDQPRRNDRLEANQLISVDEVAPADYLPENRCVRLGEGLKRDAYRGPEGIAMKPSGWREGQWRL